MFDKIKLGSIVGKVEDFVRYCPICKHALLQPYKVSAPEIFFCRYCQIEIKVQVVGGSAARG